MPLPPSRKDVTGPPPRDTSDLRFHVRHHDSYLRQIDAGMLAGRLATPKPMPRGPSQIVGSDGGGGEDSEIAWEWGDRHTITVAGTQSPSLSHVPIEDSLFVRWHPGGHGGVPLTNEFFSVSEQVVTIPDPGFFAVNDQFSFQYEYEIDDDVLEFEFIGIVAGVFHSPANTMTFTPPPAMLPGDLLVIAIRGGVAPGGGDITLGVSSGDTRVSMLYSATPLVVEGILTGFATASTADVVTNIVPNPSYSPSASGRMAIFRGVTAVTGSSAVESAPSTAGTTPVVSASAAIAVTWDGNGSFVAVDANPPSGYTEAGDTGLDYGATDISYWFDPDGTSSPPGTYVGEGCIVIGVR